MTGKKEGSKRKDRKQRWAGIIAGVLAGAMALSAIAAYAGHLFNREPADPAGPEQALDLDEYRTHYAGEIERLKNYIEEYGPAVGVLEELCRNYHLLIQIERIADPIDEAKVQGYEGELKRFSRDLVELEPDNPEYRLQLLVYYREFGEAEEVIVAEIEPLRRLLHENPAPLSTLKLIGFVKLLERQEAILDQESAWLREYLEQREASGNLDSENRYYYAFLLGEYLEEEQAAREQLALIMEAESKESDAYLAAQGYLERLQQREKAGSDGVK